MLQMKYNVPQYILNSNYNYEIINLMKGLLGPGSGCFSLFEAKPGTGKTKLIEYLLANEVKAGLIIDERANNYYSYGYIYVVPTKELAWQEANALGIKPFIEGEKIPDANCNGAMVTVIDKLPQAVNYLNEICHVNHISLIVDEAHDCMMLSDNYRSNAVNRARLCVQDMLKKGESVMFISATPDVLYGNFNFTHHIEVSRDYKVFDEIEIAEFGITSNRHDIKVCEKEADLMFSVLKNTDKIICFLNNSKNQTALQDILAENGYNSVIINAEMMSSFGVSNSVISQLRTNNTLPVYDANGRFISVYLFTSAVKTGINFNGYSDGINYRTTPLYFVEKKSHMDTDSIEQFLNRVRFHCEKGIIALAGNNYPEEQLSVAELNELFAVRRHSMESDIRNYGILKKNILMNDDSLYKQENEEHSVQYISDRYNPLCALLATNTAIYRDFQQKLFIHRRKALVELISAKFGVPVTFTEAKQVLEYECKSTADYQAVRKQNVQMLTESFMLSQASNIVTSDGSTLVAKLSEGMDIHEYLVKSASTESFALNPAAVNVLNNIITTNRLPEEMDAVIADKVTSVKEWRDMLAFNGTVSASADANINVNAIIPINNLSQIYDESKTIDDTIFTLKRDNLINDMSFRNIIYMKHKNVSFKIPEGYIDKYNAVKTSALHDIIIKCYTYGYKQSYIVYLLKKLTSESKALKMINSFNNKILAGHILKQYEYGYADNQLILSGKKMKGIAYVIRKVKQLLNNKPSVTVKNTYIEELRDYVNKNLLNSYYSGLYSTDNIISVLEDVYDMKVSGDCITLNKPHGLQLMAVQISA